MQMPAPMDAGLNVGLNSGLNAGLKDMDCTASSPGGRRKCRVAWRPPVYA